MFMICSFDAGLSNMREQLCFSGFEPRPLKDNLFFGVLSPESSATAIRRAAADLSHQHGLNGRQIDRERLHVSLHGLGRFDGLPDLVVEQAREAGALVSASPFPLIFDRVMSFGKGSTNRPIVLCPGHDLVRLSALRAALGEALRRVQIGRANSAFTPHMTLLYDRRMLREQPIVPIRMEVQDFVLVHSLVGHGRYIELARWPLRG
jgi:RNA 2',3'-cyclic 3'-phosphodiesterase